MPPTLADRLRHILTAIEDIRLMLADRPLSEFASDRIVRMAVERSFEIMSEASRYIPSDLKEAEKDIDWQKLANLGNRSRHVCPRIDPIILWNIAENDLAPLTRFVERIVAGDDPTGRLLLLPRDDRRPD
jgi:uncharacterized protein with HEPN domain